MIQGTAERPRFAVYRSNRHLFAQLIDDDKGHTVAAASTIERVEVRDRLLERAFIVRLTLPTEETIRRQAASDHRRAMTTDELALLTEHREQLFESIENLRLDARSTVDELVDEIRVRLDL